MDSTKLAERLSATMATIDADASIDVTTLKSMIEREVKVQLASETRDNVIAFPAVRRKVA